MILDDLVTRGEMERDGQYLVITGAGADAARKEVETWLKKIGVVTNKSRRQ